MFKNEEIEKIFESLGLKTENDRQKILSQGVLHKHKGEPKYQIVLDNATTLNEERGSKGARLE